MKKYCSYVLLVTLVVNLFVIGIVSAQVSEKVPVIVLFNGKSDSGLIRALGGVVKYEYGLFSGVACSLPENAIDALKRNPNVASVELDIQVHALDVELDNSWGVNRIGAGDVHSSGNSGDGVKVAILDTGVDADHPDLVDSVVGWIDYVNDVDGLDNAYDDGGHGTHCAGIVSANDDGVGVVGVAPDADLYVAKVLDSSGSGLLSDVAAGIDWAVGEGVQVISMSLGADGYTDTLKIACDGAEDAGVLVVAAAGNDYARRNKRIEIDTVDYPGAFSSVVAVAATDSGDLKASFSSTGPDVELAAPGVSVLSTFPLNLDSDGYAVYSGTSMACPHVAGVAALVFASNPGSSGAQVRAMLQGTADDLGEAGVDTWYGYGLVDADEAAGVVVSEPEVPGAVDDLSVSTVSSNELALSWSGVDFAVEYNIYRDSIYLATVTQTSYNDVGLVADTAYTYYVRGVNSVGQEGPISNEVVGTTDVTSEPGVFEVLVDPIETELVKVAGRNKFWESTVVVTVLDEGAAALGVTVLGDWLLDGVVVSSSTGVTVADGTVTLSSGWVKSTNEPLLVFVVLSP